MSNLPVSRGRLSVHDQRKLIRVYEQMLVLLKDDPSPWVPLMRARLLQRIRAVRWQDYAAMLRLGIYDASQHRRGA